MDLELLKKRSSIFRSIIFILAIALSLRFLSFSIFPPQRGKNGFSEKKIGRVVLYPHRGIIRDINGAILVNNDLAYDVYWDLDGLSSNQKHKTLKELESFFPFSDTFKSRILSANRGTFLIRSGIDPQKAETIRTLAIKNIIVVPADKRIILMPSLKGVIGKANSSYGISGLEKKYNEILAPRFRGEVLYARHGVYRMYGDTLETKPAVDGGTLYITIDMNIQHIAEEVLCTTVKKYNGAGGEIIVMDPEDGEIRAITSVGSIKSVIGDIFEPGSSMKPVTVSIGLETHSVKATDTFYSKGYIKPSPLSNVIIHDIDKYGTVTVADALRISCNAGIIGVAKKIVNNVGEDGFYKHLLAFGFGTPTGIDLNGESRGILRSSSKWSAVDYAEIAIGQGIGVTALQLLDAISAIANDGIMAKPCIVDKWVMPDGKVEYTKVEKRRVISAKTARIVKGMLRSVVTNGTGMKANIPDIDVAGKTGTAQKPSPEGGYSKRKYYSIFVGFYPIDIPKYSIIIVIDDPKGEYYGGDVAAPAFKELVTRIVSYEKGSRFAFEEVMNTSEMAEGNEHYLPDLRGKTLGDVFAKYEKWKETYPNIQLKINGYGRVATQAPDPGTLFSKVKVLMVEMKP